MHPPENQVPDRAADERDLLPGAGEPLAELVDHGRDRQAGGVGQVGHGSELYARHGPVPRPPLALPV